MSKPKLSDYGLKGIDSRPQIDVEASPITHDERLAALEALIAYQVETFRVRAFRLALTEHEWNER